MQAKAFAMYTANTRDVQYIMRLCSSLLRFTKYKDTRVTIINMNQLCSKPKKNSFIKRL